MNIVTYDGSWQGFLTAVFEIYEYKLTDVNCCNMHTAPATLFGKVHHAQTNAAKADRVLGSLQKKLSATGLQNVYKNFLSELPDVENTMVRFLQYVIASKQNVENNYGNADVLKIQQISKKVHREKHRMDAFIRFQRTKDDLYFAIVKPDFNVLPLIASHFEKRYADQRWLIYDELRKYGIYYDLQNVNEVALNFTIDTQNAATVAAIYNEEENLYQMLWQQYFSSVNIKARKNTKLHIQHMPRRYWKFLTEKQPHSPKYHGK